MVIRWSKADSWPRCEKILPRGHIFAEGCSQPFCEASEGSRSPPIVITVLSYEHIYKYVYLYVYVHVCICTFSGSRAAVVAGAPASMWRSGGTPVGVRRFLIRGEDVKSVSYERGTPVGVRRFLVRAGTCA